MPDSASFTWNTTEYTITVGELGQESTIEATRIIRKLTGAQFVDILTEEVDLIAETVLPYQNQLFVEAADPDGAGPDPPALPAGITWQQFARYRGHTLTYAQNQQAVIARMRWSTMYVVDPTYPEAAAEKYALPSSIEYVARTRMSKLYRTGWSVTPPPASDASADIGGTAIAGGFQGTDQPVGQVAIRMRFMQDASAVPMDTAAQNLTDYMGTINSVAFAGCAAGSLICEGVSVAKTGTMEYYEVTFEFLFDRWYHHEQVPTFAEDGNPKLNASLGPAEVKWKRLPRTSVNFNDIYATNVQLQTITENGWWA